MSKDVMMSDDLSLIHVDSRGDTLVVSVEVASVDSANAAAIQEAIEAAATAAPGTAVLLDLAEVERLTSMGLGVLVYLHSVFRRANRRFGVCGARGEAAAVIRLAMLDRLLEVCGSVGEFLLRVRSADGT